MRKLIYLPVLIIFFSCAKQGFPPGGPVDKRPPQILRTFPASDSTNVATDVRVEIEFNETVDKRSCEDALYITPFPGENVRYRWKGRTLRIEFPAGLLEDRTYVITIGAGTKDLRNNPMTESFSFAFSTGAEIDPGRISGRVIPPQGMTVAELWAYDLGVEPQPNPSVTSPIYITQTNQDGSYQFEYLALSRYRVFGVIDRDKNGLYERQFDMIGVAPKDAELSSEVLAVDNVNVQIALEDTIAPQISDVRAPDNRHAIVRFSEAVREDSLLSPGNITIATGSESLDILNVHQDPRNGAYVHLATAEQRADAEYILQVRYAADLAGNVMESSSGIYHFLGATLPDTIRPRYLSMIPADSSNLVPLDSEINIHFSEAMDTASLCRHFSLSDTLGRRVKGQLVWPNKSMLKFRPGEALAEETNYLVTVPVDSVFDLTGNPLEDTLFVKKFKTVDKDTLSEIAGIIVDEDTTASGPFFIQAKSMTGATLEMFVEGEKYSFRDILPGRYTLYLYRDEDENGEYSRGRVFPFQPSERFHFYPDTIEVRSRWPNEGNDVLFPR